MPKPDHLTLCETLSRSPLEVALDGFLLDHEASRCTKSTLSHYRFAVGGFVRWLLERGLESPQTVSPTHIRAYLVHLQQRGLKDTTQRDYGRAIRIWFAWQVSP